MALIKTLTMMTGEFDLDDYFHWDETKDDFGHMSAQLIFVLFIVFVSIVIGNLLIALTVSKTEELFKKAGTIRLEKTVIQVTGVEAIINRVGLIFIKMIKSNQKFTHPRVFLIYQSWCFQVTFF